jgi:hypothetical protein
LVGLAASGHRHLVKEGRAVGVVVLPVRFRSEAQL